MMEDDMLVSVVSPRFCVGRSMDVAITKRVWRKGNFLVNDVHGNLMFKVETPFFSFDSSTLILDAANIPVVTLQKKIFSVRSRWQVFRGVSTKEEDLIFSVRKSSIFQIKTKLHVFFANTKSEDFCDYTVQRIGWFQTSCKVYVGESSTIVAQMKENFSIGSKFTGKDRFMVTVSPNIDYAFIVALIIIFDEINSQTYRRSNNKNRFTDGFALIVIVLVIILALIITLQGDITCSITYR